MSIKLNSNLKIVAMVLCYNCEKMLEQAKNRIPFDFFDEVYLIENGSQDKSAIKAKELGFKVVKFEKNYGYGRAVKRGLYHGFEIENADYVVEIHGDGAEFDPKAVFPAIEFMNNGFDLITGSRFQEKSKALVNGMSYIRFFANIALSSIDRFILRLNLTEFHVGFKIYSKNLFNKIPWYNTSDNYLHNFQIIAQCAYFKLKICEVKVEADYNSLHSSASLYQSSLYAILHFFTLFEFLFAKFFNLRNKLFKKNVNIKQIINNLKL